IEGEPAVRAHDLMVSNNQNTPPSALMQPSGTPPSALAAGDPAALEPAAPQHGAVWEGASAAASRLGGTLRADEDEA
ncbi:hypothetical protein CAI21_22345, partial [Alkalilimnicola ehrlichii]